MIDCYDMIPHNKFPLLRALLFSLLSFFVLHGVQASEGGWVDDCQPCELNIEPGKKPYLVTFALASEDEDSRVIKSIFVSSSVNSKKTQTLLVDFMTPALKGEKFYIEAVDINFDGVNDLSLVVAMGAANSYAKYWLYNPASKSFDYLNEYPTFKIDQKSKSLSSFERGGHGGMIYETTLYKFLNKKLTVIKIEKQDWLESKQVYINTVKELKNGALTLVKKVSIDPPK